ncbi:hypothetical protein AgCh_021340 [Apium graveolens]
MSDYGSCIVSSLVPIHEIIVSREVHSKPLGSVFPQLLRTRLSAIGRLRLVRPKMLALMAVQRQSAASRLTRPSRRAQHGSVGGAPMTTFFTKLSTSAHTPNLRAFIVHFPAGATGVTGGGLVPGQVLHELAKEKNRMLSVKNRTRETFLVDAISGTRFMRNEGFC